METTSLWGTELFSEDVWERPLLLPESALGGMWAKALWIPPFWAQELLGYI